MLDVWRSSEYTSVSFFSRLSLTSCFKHFQAFYWKMFITLAYSGTFRHIENPRVFRHIRKLRPISTNSSIFKILRNSKIKYFAKIAATTNFTSSILEVWQNSECASASMHAFCMTFCSWITVLWSYKWFS